MRKALKFILPLNLFLALAVFSGCRNEENPGQHPDQDGNLESAFDIQIGEIDEISARYSVYPENKEMYYVCFTDLAERLENEGLTDDEVLWQNNLATIRSVAEENGISLEELITGLYGQKGDVEHRDLTGLIPGKEYILYAYGIGVTGNEASRLTGITRISFETRDVNRSDIAFDITYKVFGPAVIMDVQPQSSYSGYLYYDLLENVTDVEETRRIVEEEWYLNLADFISFGYSREEIAESACEKGHTSFEYMLSENTDCMGFAIAISDEAYIVSKEICCSPVHTGSIEEAHSDNEIGITVDNIRSRSADIHIRTSNGDPYSYRVFEAAYLEGMNDEEIMLKCIQDIQLGQVTGDRSFTQEELLPDTEYSVIAYGCVAGMYVTGLFREDFRSAAEETSTATVEVGIPGYYDLEAVIALDPGWGSYAGLGDVFANVVVTTDPEDAGKVYSIVYSTADYGNDISDELLFDVFMQNGPDPGRSTIQLFNYNEEYIAAAMVKDASGRYSKIWRSEPITFTPDGVSDPEAFLELVK